MTYEKFVRLNPNVKKNPFVMGNFLIPQIRRYNIPKTWVTLIMGFFSISDVTSI